MQPTRKAAMGSWHRQRRAETDAQIGEAYIPFDVAPDFNTVAIKTIG